MFSFFCSGPDGQPRSCCVREEEDDFCDGGEMRNPWTLQNPHAAVESMMELADGNTIISLPIDDAALLEFVLPDRSSRYLTFQEQPLGILFHRARAPLKVARIPKQTMADKLGVKVGWTLHSVNCKPLPEDFSKAMEEVQKALDRLPSVGKKDHDGAAKVLPGAKVDDGSTEVPMLSTPWPPARWQLPPLPKDGAPELPRVLELRRQVLALTSESPQDRKKALKQMLLHWHPDKKLDPKEKALATQVFHWLHGVEDVL
eukprot:gb/GFBE01057339.1/.p1 GENE.gb/GFBE01057339.1/~~gb/GFBE01057339.1/.p1  ORF type:complete len:258 (+),score=46.67 gb/GFBE01057339.1/:1-774(+)